MGPTSSEPHLADRTPPLKGEEAPSAVPTVDGDGESATALLSEPIWRQETRGQSGRDNGLSGNGLDGLSPSPEAPEGHVHELAELLESIPNSGPPYEEWSGPGEKEVEFPDVFRVPIPNKVFRVARRASAPAARLAFLLARHAYRYEEENASWRASPRWSTFSDLREYFRTGLALAPATASRAARELKNEGLIEIKGGGHGSPLQMRWTLSAPSVRYTYLPTALVELHGRVSHSAWAVLVQIYHRTWGRTRREWQDGGFVTVHQCRARLPHSDLAELAGLSAQTVRSATAELVDKSLLDRERPRGDAYHYRPTSPDKDARFFRIGRGHISNTENGRNTGAHTREREENPSEETAHDPHTGGKISEAEMAERISSPRQIPKTAIPPGDGPPESFSAVEEGLYYTLTSPSGFDLPRAWTIRMIKGRTEESIRRALRAYQRQKGDIESPSGWLRTALEKQWFASTTNDHSSGGIAARGFCGPAEGKPGVAHDTMCNLIQVLNQPEFSWEAVDRPNETPRFVPSRELANWAYLRRESGGGKFQRAARIVVNLRVHYEDRKSPLDGG